MYVLKQLQLFVTNCVCLKQYKGLDSSHFQTIKPIYNKSNTYSFVVRTTHRRVNMKTKLECLHLNLCWFQNNDVAFSILQVNTELN